MGFSAYDAVIPRDSSPMYPKTALQQHSQNATRSLAGPMTINSLKGRSLQSVMSKVSNVRTIEAR